MSRANGIAVGSETGVSAFDTIRWIVGKRESSARASTALLHERMIDANPIRKGAQFQNRWNAHGSYYWQRTRSHVWHESALELHCLEWLDFENEALEVVAQPFEITFRDGSETTRHTPDFFAIVRSGGQVVYDVKPLDRMKSEKVVAQFAETARVCADVGWSHVVMNERSEMATLVVTHLSKARNPNSCPGADVLEQARNVFASGRSLGEGRSMLNRRHPALVMPIIKHLIWHGHLRIDVEQPLTLDTRAATTGKDSPCSCE